MKRKNSHLLLPLSLWLFFGMACSDGGGTKGSGVADGESSSTEPGISAPRATGTVTNRNGNPIPGAVVTNQNTGAQVTTNAEGQYELPTSDPSVCVSAAFEGEEEAFCYDSPDNPSLPPQSVVDFVLDVPDGDIPVSSTDPVPPPAPNDGADQGRACGGLLGLGCATGEFCDYPIDAICGAADATGICKVIPEVCPEIFAPVCGCDGKTYENSCFAAGNGVSAAANGPCPEIEN